MDRLSALLATRIPLGLAPGYCPLRGDIRMDQIKNDAIRIAHVAKLYPYMPIAEDDRLQGGGMPARLEGRRKERAAQLVALQRLWQHSIARASRLLEDPDMCDLAWERYVEGRGEFQRNGTSDTLPLAWSLIMTAHSHARQTGLGVRDCFDQIVATANAAPMPPPPPQPTPFEQRIDALQARLDSFVLSANPRPAAAAALREEYAATKTEAEAGGHTADEQRRWAAFSTRYKQM